MEEGRKIGRRVREKKSRKEASGRHLGSIQEASGEHPGAIWEASGRHPGGIWEASGRHLGGILEASGTPGGHGAPGGSESQKSMPLSAKMQHFLKNVNFTFCF